MALVPGWEMVEREGLQESKRIFRSAIERMHARVTTSDTWQSTNSALTEHLLERLNINWDGYKRAQDKLDKMEPSGEVVNQFSEELDEVATIFDNTRRLMRARINALAAQDTVRPVKASEIILPKFTGKQTEWSPWCAMVTSRVLNQDLPVHDKISLIHNALEGQAKKCVGIPEGQDKDELDRIWTKLQEVYENKYQLARAHLARILDLPVLTQPSAHKMQIMIDVTEYTLRAMDRLCNNVNSWDVIICEILLRKLDAETLKTWEMNREIESLPSLTAIYQFLRKRIQALQNIRHSIAGDGATPQSSDGNSAKRPRREDHRADWRQERQRSQTSSSGSTGSAKVDAGPSPQLVKYGKCVYRPVCTEKALHFLWNCKAFRQLGNQQRLEIVQKTGLCKRCALEKHDHNACTARTCGNCTDDAHNNLFCPKHRVMVNSVAFRSSNPRYPGTHNSVKGNRP